MQQQQKHNYSTATAGSQYSGHPAYSNPHSRAVIHPPGSMKRPRFHPAAIIVLVLAIGLVFVGLVMTIISVWPGYTPVGGNPLKIVGPILLCVGVITLVATIAYSCVYSKNKSMAMMNMSRRRDPGPQSSTLASTYPPSHHSSHLMTSSRQQLAPQTPTPSVEAKPGKSILKNASSTSTYNGTAHSDSGQNRSRDSDLSSGSGSVRMDGVQVSMRPDPTAHGGFPNHAYQSDQHHGNTAYDSYDQHNTSGSLANTSIGSGSASQSLVGMGMLSPLAATSQPRTQPPSAKTKGWGQTRTGTSNRAYEPEPLQQSASTMSHAYRDVTPQRYPASSVPVRTPQYSHPQPAAAPNSSTEV